MQLINAVYHTPSHLRHYLSIEGKSDSQEHHSSGELQWQTSNQMLLSLDDVTASHTLLVFDT